MEAHDLCFTKRRVVGNGVCMRAEICIQRHVCMCMHNYACVWMWMLIWTRASVCKFSQPNLIYNFCICVTSVMRHAMSDKIVCCKLSYRPKIDILFYSLVLPKSGKEIDPMMIYNQWHSKQNTCFIGWRVPSNRDKLSNTSGHAQRILVRWQWVIRLEPRSPPIKKKIYFWPIW